MDTTAVITKPTTSKLRWRPLSDVEPESVKYLQPGRIPFGKLTLLVGDPGIGKSRMTLDLAARVSTGTEWPTGGRAPLGNVIVLSAEDGVADTIRPSVDTFGGDPSCVIVVD